MATDAWFEDGREAPLNLGALTGDDLTVLSALAQDAVFPIIEMKWDRPSRRLVCLINRFRWEDAPAAQAHNRRPERVQSLLVINSVTAIASQGIDRSDVDVILSLLSVTFDGADDGAGHVTLTLAGDGAIRASVEALDVTLRDVTRPYTAPSGKVPHHPE
jgi:hypothetical protein